MSMTIYEKFKMQMIAFSVLDLGSNDQSSESSRMNRIESNRIESIVTDDSTNSSSIKAWQQQSWHFFLKLTMMTTMKGDAWIESSNQSINHRWIDCISISFTSTVSHYYLGGSIFNNNDYKNNETDSFLSSRRNIVDVDVDVVVGDDIGGGVLLFAVFFLLILIIQSLS